jgi:phenylpropionate dioxygenase-like ring-hydroxylating dioxygenase large terminal subunit
MGEVALDEWQVAAAVAGLRVDETRTVRLLDYDISLLRQRDDQISAWIAGSGRVLPVQQKFGHVWTCLGTPARPLFAIPEYDEPDRRNVIAAQVPVHVSAPRAVENFLDLGHFAYVHGGYLGAEPHTEIKPYSVSIEQDEVIASGCRAYQPRASLISEGGFEVEYVYRVPHPYCAVLYKSSVLDKARRDVIALFVQPEGEERIVAHMLASVLDPTSSDQEISDFQQLIFAQDKPILENQIPKRLPLNPHAELWARADAGSAAYRRWLSARGVRYGTIPA